MTRFKHGLLSVGLVCIVIGLALKLDRAILAALGISDAWLSRLQVLDHIVFPVGVLLFVAFIVIHGRDLKREKEHASSVETRAGTGNQDNGNHRAGDRGDGSSDPHG